MSSNGPPGNCCKVLEVNLKTCVKETKWRVYILTVGILNISNGSNANFYKVDLLGLKY